MEKLHIWGSPAWILENLMFCKCLGESSIIISCGNAGHVYKGFVLTVFFFFSVSNIIPFWVGKWAVTIVRALSLSPAQQSGFNSCAWHQSNVVDCCFLLVLILAPRTLFPYALLFLPLQILTLKIPNSTWRAAPWKGHYLSTIPIDLHHLFLPFFFFFFLIFRSFKQHSDRHWQSQHMFWKAKPPFLDQNV